MIVEVILREGTSALSQKYVYPFLSWHVFHFKNVDFFRTFFFVFFFHLFANSQSWLFRVHVIESCLFGCFLEV